MGWVAEAEEEASRRPMSPVEEEGGAPARELAPVPCARRRHRGRATVGGSSPSWSTACSLLGHNGMNAAPLLLVVGAGCSPATPTSSSSPTSTATAEARGAAPTRHRSVAGRWLNCSPELSKGLRRRLGFTAEGVRVRLVSAARAGTCTVQNGPSTGAREIFSRARPLTGSASSHAQPVTRETAEILRVPEL
jgi:hypothetical protein